MNYTLPMRVYRADKGRERYSVTVVDYSSIERRASSGCKTCPPGNANCRATLAGLGVWLQRFTTSEARSCMPLFTLLQRDAKLNYMAWEWQDLVEGHLVQLTRSRSSPARSRGSGMHAHKLYIVEGTVPARLPQSPACFSSRWDGSEQGGQRPAAIEIIYSNS